MLWRDTKLILSYFNILLYGILRISLEVCWLQRDLLHIFIWLYKEGSLKDIRHEK